MSKSSLHIVLVDPLGDVLFSGESMIATETVAAREVSAIDDERCPQTRRSAGSGVFEAAAPRRPSSPVIEVSPMEARVQAALEAEQHALEAEAHAFEVEPPTAKRTAA